MPLTTRKEGVMNSNQTTSCLVYCDEQQPDDELSGLSFFLSSKQRCFDFNLGIWSKFNLFIWLLISFNFIPD